MGLVYLGLYLVLARLLRITEVTDVMKLITRRLRGREVTIAQRVDASRGPDVPA